MNALCLLGAAALLLAPPPKLQGIPPRRPAPRPGGPCLLRPFLQGLELPEEVFPHVQEERKGGFSGALAIAFLRLLQPGVFPISKCLWEGEELVCAAPAAGGCLPLVLLHPSDEETDPPLLPALSRGCSPLLPVPLAPLPCAITIFLPVSRALLGHFHGSGVTRQPLLLPGRAGAPSPFCRAALSSSFPSAPKEVARLSLAARLCPGKCPRSTPGAKGDSAQPGQAPAPAPWRGSRLCPLNSSLWRPGHAARPLPAALVHCFSGWDPTGPLCLPCCCPVPCPGCICLR